MRRLIARPATAVIDQPNGVNMIVCQAAYLSDEHDFESTLELEGAQDIWMMDIGKIDVDVPNRMTGTTAGSGFPIVVRATIEDDAVALPSLPGYPLPVPVIIGSITGENMDTHIEALVEDDGYVSTLLLVTDMGLYTRYSRTWIRLAEVDLIDGLNSVNVDDGAVDVYDTADDTGQQVNIEGLPREGRDAVGLGELFVAASAPRTFNPDGDNEAALTAAFDANLHPRGRDGQFIEVGGLLKITSSGERGRVESIDDDPNDPGNPTIRLKTMDGGTIDVKGGDVEQAPEKARLDTPPDVSNEVTKAQRQVDKDQAEVDRIEAELEELRPSQADRKDKLREDRSRAWSFLANSQAALERAKKGVASSGFNPDVPVIDTSEQLLAALETAREDESLRWYVERRAKALGVEVDLPWL